MLRCLDFILALILLIILAPVFLIISILVWACLGRPVLYKHYRVGRYCDPFMCYKFRSMRDAHDAQGLPLSDEERLTPFGQWLRAMSLDELPQLINVLKGDMSLVGPRPNVLAFLPYYSQEQVKRHDVRPGITGWAQVNGRNSISHEQKFALDCYWVDNRSLRFYVYILLQTVFVVLGRQGISEPGQATYSEFTGSKKS